ncbi:penicillin-binding protein 2 [Candidatus Omnitrophota bacterium]
MRVKTLRFFFIILFVGLFGCLFYLQIIKGPFYKNLSYRNSIRLLNINSPRGIIYDRFTQKLAYNVLSFSVFIVPQEVVDIDSEIKELSKILGVRESLLRRNYKRNYYAPFAPCELMRDVSKEKAILTEELRLDMPGVLVKEVPLRMYPYKEAFLHLVGYMGEIDRRELKLLKSYGYNIKDLIGKDGIERVADDDLRGRSGGRQVQVDNMGHQVKVLSFKGPKRGKDVYLTVDAGLQSFLWKMMEGKKGAAIFMDPNNGEILALVSSPSHDPNVPLTDEVLSDLDAPLLNRAIMGQYPPGSLFKILISAGGLESGVIDSETSFVCRGTLDVGIEEFGCWNRDGHGPMKLNDAIVESCNVYFYNTGIRLGLERIYEYARKLGFGKKTGIELFGEMEGFLPSRAWKKIKRKENWYAGDTANLSIGQGYLLVTPLQVVRMVASVANGGKLIRPHVFLESDLNRVSEARPLKSEENIELIKKGLKGVVEDEDGTGIQAWSELVSISGKTGTTQTGEEFKTHAWFGGFAPSDNPEISFVIFLEHGGSGGDDAALMAGKAVEYWYKSKTTVPRMARGAKKEL